MDFKSLISKPAAAHDNYWALTIEPKWVSAAVWEIEGDAVKVIAQGPSTVWETEDDLITACDTALSSAVQNLPQDAQEPNKTVFGVTSSWVDGGNIKEEYLEKLKKVCQDLSLEPSGFVVIGEAIAHYVKVEEGSPLTAVVVGLSEEALEVSLYKLGKLTGTTEVARSVSVVDDLVEGLVRFGTEDTYPSRIILYDSKVADLEEVRSELTDADWLKVEKVRFLHTPRVEVMSPENKVLAVCLAGASEMGGVTKIADVEAEHDNVAAPKEELSAADLGFVVEGESEPDSPTTEPEFHSNETAAQPPEPPRPHLSLPALPQLPKVNLPKFSQMPKFSNPMKNRGGNFAKPLIMGGSTLFAFILIGFLYWWFYPKANVVLYVSPKKLDETTTLTLGSELKTKSEEVEVTGQKTKSTTGTKTVGDRAKGSVKIQNGTAFPINLAAGTVLLSSSDLRFTVSQSASVSGALTPTSPGTATVEITASNIGSEYNLAKDEVFKVGNYPKAEVDAVSSSDFTGGSSRQISAVSEDDIEDITNELTDELVTEAKKKLTEKIATDEVLLDSLITTEVVEEDLSNKLGDEATNLKLSLNIKAMGQVVAKKDLTAITSKVLEGKVPTGFVVRDDQIVYKFEKNEEDDEKINLDMAVNLLPIVDPTEVAKKIVGRYPLLAEQYLKDVPGFVRAEFKITPLFPGKLGTLPHLAKKITVEISAVR
jgi:hypothetical protein